MVVYDADWWIKRIAIASGALTVIGLVWRPTTKWLRERFDAKVTQTLRRCKVEVRTIMKEDVFPKDIADYMTAMEKIHNEHATTHALAQANEDRLEGHNAIIKAQGVALMDIPRIAGQMEGLPRAIESLTTTMMAIHKEVGEIRGEMKGWDGVTDRRSGPRRKAAPGDDTEPDDRSKS